MASLVNTLIINSLISPWGMDGVDILPHRYFLLYGAELIYVMLP